MKRTGPSRSSFGWGAVERLQELQVHHTSDTKGGGLLGEMDR